MGWKKMHGPPGKPKTEGQRLFLEIKGEEFELAEKIGCGAAAVGHWRRGRRIPGKTYRHKLELLFGIPQRAWDVVPGAKIPSEKTSEKKASSGPSSSSRTSSDEDTLEITKAQIASILTELDDDNLTDGATSKLRDTLAKLLALRARMERDQEMLEDRAVREHPEWLKVKSAILNALKPFPKASAAVIEALK